MSQGIGKKLVVIIRTNENHIEREIERHIRDGYVLQGNVVVESGDYHQSCHWVYVATMVLGSVITNKL